MNEHGLTRENFVATLPPALRTDPSVVALAEAIGEVLAARPAEIGRLLIYPAIDTLDEPLLDILAHDFKVDWWDPEYSLEEKRRTLKDSWRVHRTLGTKAAVETAISAVYPNTQVLEWFEYGGEPYHFRLDINITNDSIDSAKQRRVLERLNFYKSLRSHNDGVNYFVEAEPAIAKAGGCVPGVWEAAHVPLELPVPQIQPTAPIFLGVATGLWEAVTARLDLDVPRVERLATARIGATAGLHEAFAASMDLSMPTIQRLASVRLGAIAGLYEEFAAQAVLPDAPARCTASLGAVASSLWQECYVTEAVPLMDKVLTVTAQTQAKSVVASTQELVKTHINLQEENYG